MLILNKQFLALTIGALVLGFATQASALTYTLNHSFGEVPVSGDIVITLTDAGAATVTLDIDLTALNSIEFIKELYLNTETEVTGITGTGLASYDYDNAAHKADGDGYHDLLLGFYEAESDRLNGGAIHSFTLTGPGLDASDFYDLGSLSPNGQFYAVAKINGTGGDGEGSDWVGAIPEPTSAVLFAVGAVVVGQATRRAPKNARSRT